jgi:tetratricopeptide (TPR) repeat protein
MQYNLAIIDFNKAIAIDPTFSWAYLGRGNCYFAIQQYDSAIADYTKLIELTPNDPIGYQNRAYAYEAKGDHARAQADRAAAERLQQ